MLTRKFKLRRYLYWQWRKEQKIRLEVGKDVQTLPSICYCWDRVLEHYVCKRKILKSKRSGCKNMDLSDNND